MGLLKGIFLKDSFLYQEACKGGFEWLLHEKIFCHIFNS